MKKHEFHLYCWDHIAIAKCDLFFSYCHAKEISFYYFRDIKLCAKHEKACEFHLYCSDHVCKVNEWCLVDCFHRKFRVSTQLLHSNMQKVFRLP